jgi:hypothetical protein
MISVDEGARERQEALAARGMGLISDFVPNHVALIIHDTSKPELFPGTADELRTTRSPC